MGEGYPQNPYIRPHGFYTFSEDDPTQPEAIATEPDRDFDQFVPDLDRPYGSVPGTAERDYPLQTPDCEYPEAGEPGEEQ